MSGNGTAPRPQVRAPCRRYFFRRHATGRGKRTARHPTAKSTNPPIHERKGAAKRRVSSRFGAGEEKQKSCDGARTNVSTVQCLSPLFASVAKEVESHSSQSFWGPLYREETASEGAAGHTRVRLEDAKRLASPAEVLELTGKPVELQRVSGRKLARAGDQSLERRRKHAGPRCVRCKVGGVPFGI